jgi:photosystem II stability/assembly factor-like uncharacterized protein
MKLLTGMMLLCLCTILPSGLQAQTWHWQHPLPNGHNLYDIVFTDAQHGWIAGGYGKILNTTDGGTTWTPRETYTTNQFGAIAFATPTTGFAAGIDGPTNNSALLATFDGGESWNPYLGLGLMVPRDMCFKDSLHGWICGDYAIYRTNDGGNFWQQVYMDFYHLLNHISFADSLNGWCAGFDGNGNYGVILHSSDGGATWQLQNSNSFETLFGVAAISPTTAYVSGSNGTMLKTTDGGTNWEPLTTNTDAWLYTLVFQNAQTGYAAGDAGRILRTHDGGTTWDVIDSHQLFNPNELAFKPDGSLWLVGNAGTLLHSSDDAVTWLGHCPDLAQTITGISFPDPQNGWCAGSYGRLMSTTNGGIEWASHLTSGVDAFFYDVYFVNTNTGFVVGDGDCGRTTDGGLTWAGSPSSTNELLLSVSFANERNGWAAGLAGTIIHTSDGGAIWSPQDCGVLVDLWGVAAADSLTAWVCGFDGNNYPYTPILMKTTDGGNSWVSQFSQSNILPLGICCVNPQHAWAVGYDVNRGSAMLMRTVDGSEWQVYRGAWPHILYNVYFTDEMNGISVGAWGFIARTTNGGARWEQDSSGTDNTLSDAAMASPGQAWAAGSSGTILGFTGASAVHPVTAADLPGDYNVAAYPNPFNPQTTLEFSLPRTERVKLMVYDLLGRAVAVLADQPMTAGIHQLTFDGSQLASGPYFVRLTTPSRSIVHSILLLR